MAAILPVSLLADEVTAAMLRSNGAGVLLNKNSAPASTALLPDDLIETQPKAVARVEAIGSTADIHPETMVQFEGNELVLEHGSLSVNTSRGLRVRVGCLTVTPVKSAEWTHYDVVDIDGKVTVSARRMTRTSLPGPQIPSRPGSPPTPAASLCAKASRSHAKKSAEGPTSSRTAGSQEEAPS